jgi:hypothetical protein
VTLAEIDEKAAASDQLKRATVTLSNYNTIHWKTGSCSMMRQSNFLPASTRLPHGQAIDTCIADNARVDVAEIRARNFAALARRFIYPGCLSSSHDCRTRTVSIE